MTTNAPIKWIPVAQELPPEGEIVLTKRASKRANHNVQFLRRLGTQWERVTPPTHWARD